MNSSLPTLEQMTDILDIKPIIQVSLLGFWLILLALLAAACFWFYRFLKKRSKPPEKPKQERKLRPRELALRDLEELDHSGILERGQYRKYYFRLSEIVRLFLQEEIHLPVVDATTEEIRPQLTRCPLLTETEKQFIGQILVEMDLVKFARLIPSAEEVKNLRDSLRRFIETVHLPAKGLALSERSESKGDAHVSS